MSTKWTGSTALLLAVSAGACGDSMLDVTPVDEIAEEIAIIDEATARSALMGAYSGVQGADDSYYATDFVLWPETLTDNVEHTGTFEEYADGDLLFLTADNGSIAAMWEDMYTAVDRANLLIQLVPTLDNIDQAASDDIVGQALALRALTYFNLVRGWGAVPLVLVPERDLERAAEVTRAPVADVYAQIEADLSSAETLLADMSNDDRTFVTPGFIDALQAKVALYQEDWATAEAEAREVVGSDDYELAASYGDLFTAEGSATDEDIFRLVFNATDFNNLGYYYTYDGRFEVGATPEIYELYDQVNDERWFVNFDGTRSDGIQVVKYPTAIGGEDVHVIRYADVLLILAESLAQQGGAANLAEAVTYLNMVRMRSGETGYTYPLDLATQQEVLDAIYLERRLEFAFETEYWFDLVRTGRAAAALGSNFQPHEVLWPLPVSELDVAPNLEQNPGY